MDTDAPETATPEATNTASDEANTSPDEGDTASPDEANIASPDEPTNSTEKASDIVTPAEEKTISDLESKIIQQIEYYFGDFNLGRDWFLKEQIKLNDGWIPLETMLKFKRLKTLSEDAQVITTALKKSPGQLVEVSEDGTQIRRSASKPLPENIADRRTDIDNRTVYVKGFKFDTNLDVLLEFFKPFGSYDNINMRRRRTNKKFKGSVFITFTSVETAEDFVKLSVVNFKGVHLVKEMKNDYVKRKDKFRDEMRTLKEEKKCKLDENGSGKTQAVESSMTKGCLLKLEGLPEGIMWTTIKDVLNKHGPVAFVSFQKGDPDATIRFKEAVAAEVLEKSATEVDGTKKIKINDVDVTATVVEGQEEIDYWAEFTDKIASERRKPQGKKQGKGRFFQRKGRKDKPDTANYEPSAKKQKTDAS